MSEPSPAWQEHQAFVAQQAARACAAPCLFDVPPVFDGATYDPERDLARLDTQMGLVHHVLQSCRWYTLAELRAQCGGSEAGISARLRDLRKPKFGAHDIRRERRTEGQYEYRLAEPCKLHQESVCLTQ